MRLCAVQEKNGRRAVAFYNCISFLLVSLFSLAHTHSLTLSYTRVRSTLSHGGFGGRCAGGVPQVCSLSCLCRVYVVSEIVLRGGRERAPEAVRDSREFGWFRFEYRCWFRGRRAGRRQACASSSRRWLSRVRARSWEGMARRVRNVRAQRRNRACQAVAGARSWPCASTCKS